MSRRTGITLGVLCVLALLPVAVLAEHQSSSAPSVLPRPRISLARALSIAGQDVRKHGALVGSSGYIARVEYGRFRVLSSGARCTCASPSSLVWAITYVDVRARTKAKQIISATTGKVLTRVYYPPPIP